MGQATHVAPDDVRRFRICQAGEFLKAYAAARRAVRDAKCASEPTALSRIFRKDNLQARYKAKETLL